jgi:hypothetical protein
MYSLLTLLRDSGLRIAAIGIFFILAAQAFCGPLDMTVFENTPGPGTLLWFACCLLPVISPKSMGDGEL